MKRGSTMTPQVSEAFRSAAMRRSAASSDATPNGIWLLWATLEGALRARRLPSVGHVDLRADGATDGSLTAGVTRSSRGPSRRADLERKGQWTQSPYRK